MKGAFVINDATRRVAMVRATYSNGALVYSPYFEHAFELWMNDDFRYATEGEKEKIIEDWLQQTCACKRFDASVIDEIQSKLPPMPKG